MKKMLSAVCLTLLLFTAVPPVHATDENGADPGAIVMDALLIRPLGLVSATIGTGVFIVSLPFAIPSGSMGTIGKKLVLDPLRFTFTRPLGADFDE